MLAPANPAVSLVKQVRNEWERLGEAIDKAAEVETERPDEAETILAPVQRSTQLWTNSSKHHRQRSPARVKPSRGLLRTLNRSPIFAEGERT